MPVVQVTYGITVGAHALLHAKGECVSDPLQGMETLTRSCFEAVRCSEVQCPAASVTMVAATLCSPWLLVGWQEVARPMHLQ